SPTATGIRRTHAAHRSGWPEMSNVARAARLDSGLASLSTAEPARTAPRTSRATSPTTRRKLALAGRRYQGWSITRLGDADHALDRQPRALCDLARNLDLEAHLAKRVPELGQRDHLHVLAEGHPVGLDQPRLRRRLLERVEHARL